MLVLLKDYLQEDRVQNRKKKKKVKDRFYLFFVLTIANSPITTAITKIATNIKGTTPSGAIMLLSGITSYPVLVQCPEALKTLPELFTAVNVVITVGYSPANSCTRTTSDIMPIPMADASAVNFIV